MLRRVGFAVLVLVVFLGLGEVLFRRHMAQTLALTYLPQWSGYSDTYSDCQASVIDAARGDTARNHRSGLMKADRDILFWWFDRTGKITMESKFHLNNLGLMSRRDYDPAIHDGEFRIVVLGDEMTGASTSSSMWPDILEDLLNADENVRPRLGPVRVFNFGHPDASVANMATFLEEKAAKLQPDLVIVNLAWHSFDRTYSNWDCIDSDGRLGEVRFIATPYAAPSGERAWVLPKCGSDGNNIKDLTCDITRPVAMWLLPSLARSEKDVKAVADQIDWDYVGSVVWSDPRPLLLLHLLGTEVDPMARRIRPRTATTNVMQAASEDDKVKFVADWLARIERQSPNLLVTLSPYYPHAWPQPKEPPQLVRLTEVSPRLAPINMATKLPLDAGAEEVRRWWQVPVASEKWSGRGHAVYARAMRNEVLRHLAARGRYDGPVPTQIELPEK